MIVTCIECGRRFRVPNTGSLRTTRRICGDPCRRTRNNRQVRESCARVKARIAARANEVEQVFRIHVNPADPRLSDAQRREAAARVTAMLAGYKWGDYE